MARLFIKIRPDETPEGFAERVWREFEASRSQVCALCQETYTGPVRHRDPESRPVCCGCAHTRWPDSAAHCMEGSR